MLAKPKSVMQVSIETAFSTTGFSTEILFYRNLAL